MISAIQVWTHFSSVAKDFSFAVCLEIPKRSLRQLCRFWPPGVRSWKAVPTALHAVCMDFGFLVSEWDRGGCRNACRVGFLLHYYFVSTVMVSFLKILKMSGTVCTLLWVPLLLTWSGTCSDWHVSWLTDAVKAGVNSSPPVQFKMRYVQPLKFYFKQNWNE